MVPPCMHNMETKLGGRVLQATLQLFHLPAYQPTFQVAELSGSTPESDFVEFLAHARAPTSLRNPTMTLVRAVLSNND
jgi:hypothetical protein